MYFVLDTNVIVAEGFGNSAHMRALLSAASAVRYTVCVPQVVLDEAVATYSRELESRAAKARDTHAKLSGLLGSEWNCPFEALDLAEETRSYLARMTDQLNASGSVILEYPEIPHATLVKRATLRRRPFDDRGRGYRDSLVWQTTLNLASQVEGTVVLVSSDRGFADKLGGLHHDLIDDLQGLGLPKDKVTLTLDIAALVDEFVRPKLGAVPWDSPLPILAQQGINLEDAIGLAIQDACLGQEWDPSELGLPWKYENPVLDAVEEVTDLTVVGTWNLPPNQILVKMEAAVLCELGVFVYKPDWYVSDDPKLRLYEFDWNDHYVRANIAVPLRCEIDIVVDVAYKGQHSILGVSANLHP